MKQTENRYARIQAFMTEKLRRELPAALYYHGIHHILDVMQAAETLGKEEHIAGKEMELLRVAVLFHDAGYIREAKDHESRSCTMAREILPEYGYSRKEIQSICGMIMATRIPQDPHNLLEEILCDADLDYLGRDDYFAVAALLYREWLESGLFHTPEEWRRIQQDFFRLHHYHTSAAQKLRNRKKEDNFQKLHPGI